MKNSIGIFGIVFISLMLTRCGVAAQPTTPDSAPTAVVEPSQRATSSTIVLENPTPISQVAVDAKVVNHEDETVESQKDTSAALPRPEHQLEDGEYRWSQLLARDSIYPIYEPRFVAADEAPYADDELVIGVEINGEAKAYAIGPLNQREMVNDTLGGIPILVTW